MPHVSPNSVVQSKSYNIKDLTSKSTYEIPQYQRDYVWKDKQVEQLWDDLFSHYKKNTDLEEIKADPEAYFLGAMVILKNDDNELNEVVDGQQRLTTFLCMAAVLLSKLYESDFSETSEVKGVRQNLEKMLYSYDGDKYEVNVRLADNVAYNFFKKSIVDFNTKDERDEFFKIEQDEGRVRKGSSAELIKSTFEVSYAKVNGFLEGCEPLEERKTRLVSLIKVFYECLIVLRIDATSHEMAYDLFESLNFRGMPLNQADLIKNELLKKSSESAREHVVESWAYLKEVVSPIGNINLPDFLHFSYISRYEYISASSLFKRVKEKLSSGVAASEFIDGVYQDACSFDRLVNIDGEWSEKTKDMLNDIHGALQIKMLYPALIAGEQSIGKKEDFEKYVFKCLSFGFRYFKVIDATVAQMANACSKIAIDIRTKGVVEEAFDDARKDASDATFVEAFKSYRVSQSKMGYFVVYYLEKFMMQGSGALPVAHGADQHLEHILPVQPKKSCWEEMYKLKEQDAESFRHLCWKIGNLLALPHEINQSIKNSSINDKISGVNGKGYKDTVLKMPKEVSRFLDGGQWNEKSINDRQLYIAENYVTKAWPL